MPADEDRAHARVEFFRMGTHYYVAGRFAALSGLFPVAGNLLHHAIEMYLKGALVDLAGLNGVRDLGHDLNRIWNEYKARVSSADAASLDSPIFELHRFERLRYPDTVVREGMDAAFTIFRGQQAEITGPNGPIRPYSLVLEDVDALVKSIFSGAGVNPKFHLQHLRDDAKGFLSKHNRHNLE
jgi:hypothetical protein